MGGVGRAVKKAVKGVTKVVKKVVKGITKVAKKVWKGVKGVVKKIGKVFQKMGPLASIAIGFIPGFQGLWASSGIWGAMGKGALVGFVTSGGKLKGALIGAAGGGLGYAAQQGASAFSKGWTGAGEGASISEKISGGFSAVGDSTVSGVSNMFDSASNLLKGGQGGLNYLRADPITGEMTSIYGKSEAASFARMDGESVLHKANEGYVSKLEPKAQKFIADNSETFKDLNPKQMNEIFENQQTAGFGVDAPGIQAAQLKGYQDYVTSEQALAKAGGYTYDKFDADSYLTPSSVEYQSVLDARGLDARSWYGDLLDQPLKPNMMDVNYRGPLTYTESSTDPDDNAFYKSKRTSGGAGGDAARKGANALGSLFGGSGDSSGGSGTKIPFGGGDTSDQYSAGGGLTSAGGTGGVSLNYADYYGGAQDPTTLALNANKQLQSILAMAK
jgi:hypothetical protein